MAQCKISLARRAAFPLRPVTIGEWYALERGRRNTLMNVASAVSRLPESEDGFCAHSLSSQNGKP